MPMSHERSRSASAPGATQANVIPPSASETATLPPSAAPASSAASGAEGAAGLSPAGYEILAELGRGGMGVVYKARHTALRRIVALKMILGGSHASSADLERFRMEAEAIARLRHPHIVQIYEVGQHQGLPYFSLEFCEGGSLDKKLAGTPLPPREAAALLEQLANAMQAAHDQGVIHRDLKPANVLLVGAGQGVADTKDSSSLPTAHCPLPTIPKITDFGLAKKLDEAGQTRTGDIMGTPSYMAPEQASGNSKELGPACDIYALGAVLYECLTGRPPFRAATPLDTVLQVVNEEPVPPRQLNPGVPRDLETICLKCLHKEPARRYGQASALGEDLRRFLAGEPITARPINRRQRLLKWARRRPASAALVVLGIASLLAFLVLGLLLYQQQEQINRQQQQALDDVTEQKNQVQAELWKTLVEQAKTERLVGNRQKSLDLLTEAGGIKFAPELRREAIETIATFGTRLISRIRAHSFSVQSGKYVYMAFSADGQYLAEATNFTTPGNPDPEAQVPWRAEVQVWSVPAGQLVAKFPTEVEDNGRFLRGPSPLAFSPVALVLAVVRTHQVHVMDLRSRQDLMTMPGDKILGFSPDGSLLVVEGKDGARVWNIAEKKQLPLPLEARAAVFASSDKLVAWDGKRLRVWDVAAGKELYALPEALALVPSDNCGTPAIDGNHLLAQRKNTWPPALVLWDLAERKIAREVASAGYAFWADGAVPVSPADGLAALANSASDQRGVQLMNTSSGDAGGRLMVEGLLQPQVLLGRFNPRGRVLAMQEADGVRLWDLPSGTTAGYFRGHHSPCWSPDGNYLALWEPMGLDLVIYEITAPVSAVPCASTPSTLTFSGDGKLLATPSQAWEVHGHGLQSWLRSKGDIPKGLWTNGLPPEMWHTMNHDSGHRLWETRFGIRQLQKDQKARFFDVGEIFPQRPAATPLEGAYGPFSTIRSFAVSADGRQMALSLIDSVPKDKGQPAFESRVELWDLAAKARSSVLPRGQTDLYSEMRFSKDGRRLFLFGGSGSAWSIWQIEPPKELCHHQELGPDDEARKYLAQVVEPDPDFLKVHAAAVSGNDFYYLRLDPIRSKIEIVRPVSRGQIGTMALSPDGSLLAIGGQDQMLRLWDTATARELAVWRAHPAAVLRLAFSPDGRVLASGGSDGVIRLWDLPFLRAELSKMQLGW
jgi:serine/threonine protein kinase/WD40 repeat protein